MKRKVLVTPRSFGKLDTTPIEILENNDIEVIRNPYGRILTKEEMKEWVQEVDGIIIGVDPMDKEVIDSAPHLKAIAKYGVGTDNIDLNYAQEKNIPVTITQGANADAVAEFTIALMLSVARKVVQIDKECRKSNWNKITTIDMNQKTLGLIGMGQIGKTVVKRLSGFEMNVLAYDLQQDEKFATDYDVTYVEHMEDVLKQADFISIHLPLNEHTKDIIDERAFNIMKPEAVIVNTARGGLINEDALLKAVSKRQIWGAGIDVFEEEPPSNKKLLAEENIIIGSHCAASTNQAIINMGKMATENLIQSLSEKV